MGKESDRDIKLHVAPIMSIFVFYYLLCYFTIKKLNSVMLELELNLFMPILSVKILLIHRKNRLSEEDCMHAMLVYAVQRTVWGGDQFSPSTM